MRCAECENELGDAAKFCPECGTAVPAAPGNAARGSTAGIRAGRPADAERRQLTVMFCDLVGSTEISVDLDPEDTRQVVRAYQEAATRVVVRFGGHVAQYTGDGILAYFGYPAAYEDAASRAVEAALAVLGGMERLRADAAKQQRPKLQVRIGLHTGMVVVGEMGGASRTETLAVGETPNIAARIQGAAEPDSVLMSEITAGLVAKRFRTEFIGERRLKGVREPLAIYRAVEAHDLIEENSRPAATPLVDRESERAALVRAWARTREGRGGAALLSGDGGIGKSRVLRFLRDHVDAADGEHRLELRCQSIRKESAFHPFVEHLNSACGFAPGDDSRTRLAKLERALDTRAPSLRGELSVFAALLLLPTPANAEPVDPMALRERIESALEAWVLAHTGAPLLFVVEDLHWADASTLDVLTRLIQASRRRPLMVMLSFRPEFEIPAAWTALEWVEHLGLQRMRPGDIRSIIQNVCSGISLPPDVLNELLDRIDGVPIYAEELTKSVMLTGASHSGHEPGDARRTNLSDLVIPATLQDSLMARLDRLGPIRAVAQMGAVIGREFHYRTLLALSGSDEVALQRALVKLADSDVLIQAGAFPGARFAFRHALLHEATYGALLRDTRHEMHAEVGRILERSDGAAGPVLELPEEERIRLLSYHWHRAVPAKLPEGEVVEKAITYLIRAGEQQLAVSGYREAESHFRRALGHLPALAAGARRDELELLARVRLSTVLKATVGPAAEEVREELSRSRDLCLQLGARPELGSVLYSYWQLHLFRAQYPLALTVAEECRREALRAGDEDLLIQSHAALANTQFWFGDLNAAHANATTALARYDRDKHARHAVSFGMDPGVLALMFGSWIPQLRGETELARSQHEQLLRLSAELDHPLSKALALNTSCCFYVNDGDAEGALRAGESLLAIARRHGLQVYEMFGVLFRGWAIAEQGNVDEVIDEVRETYRNYVTYVGGLAQTFAALLVASVYVRAGLIDDALEVLDQVMVVAAGEHCCERVYEAELLRLKAELLATRPAGDRAEIEDLLRRALELARSRGEHAFVLRAATTLSTFLDGREVPLTQAAALSRES